MKGSAVRYEFTNSWFADTAEEVWRDLIPKLNIRKALEIGSYEGASACFLLENVPGIELTCIDTWQGGAEHAQDDMKAVQRRFNANTGLAVENNPDAELSIRKCTSLKALSTMLNLYMIDPISEELDFIYIDGSHEAPDVLTDAVMAYPLLRKGGMMVFDDYLWSAGGRSPIDCPKIAIDAFTTIFGRKMAFVRNVPLWQIWLQKV